MGDALISLYILIFAYICQYLYIFLFGYVLKLMCRTFIVNAAIYYKTRDFFQN